MPVQTVNPASNLPLVRKDDALVDGDGASFPVVREVARICDPSNYAQSFGRQWNTFATTQIDDDQNRLSSDRFFVTTGWTRGGMAGETMLEVGSGAGRFSRVVLAETKAELYSVDFSDAVSANWANNATIAPGRFHLFQASVYEMPFPDGAFDKVFCMGVLQHTPDFAQSVKALVDKARPGGEIVVDFYEIRGWWTRLHAKYLLRPLTRRMSHERLERWIDSNADWLIACSRGLRRIGLVALTRFLPVVDLRTFDCLNLTPAKFREWVVLDTFDMFSPEHDHPQTIAAVAAMFVSAGADVAFAGHIETPSGCSAVVRAVRKPA